MMHFLRLCILVFLLPVGLSAQPEGQSKVLVCSFLHWDNIPDEKLFFRMGEEYHPIEFKRGERAGKISLKRMAEFEIFRELENTVEGELPYEFLANAPVAGHINKVMLMVIAPDDDDEGQYQLIAVDDSTDVFPRGSSLFVNLTHKKMSVNFANQSKVVAPEKMCVIPSKVKKKGGFVPCIITGVTGKRIFETRLFCQRSVRKHVFVRSALKEGDDKPRIKFLSEPLPVELKVPASGN